MTTNVIDDAFNETDDIVVRMYTTTGGNSTFDITCLTIDFQENGVLVTWNPTELTTSRAFIPYTNINQVFQGL